MQTAKRGRLVARERELEITESLDWPGLVEEVRRTNTPVVLRRDGEPIAALRPLPARKARKRPSPESVAAFLATAGTWRGHVDAEELKRQIKAARSDHRPPVELR
jgi:antitoxin (DNA-binding transcriptional repressor) of toxin-antitoxin stability system